MRIAEANTFLKAFRDTDANHFIQRMLKKNYLEAILMHHPDPASVSREQIQEQCNTLVNEIFARIERIKDKPEGLFPLFYTLSRNNPQRSSIWFDEFISAYYNYKHNRKLRNRLKQLEPFLYGNSYCDIGCGGGDLIVFLKDNHPQFEIYAGIDVLDWRTDSLKSAFNFQMLDFSRVGQRSVTQYDTLTCLAVLHHVGNTDEAVSVFLKNIRSAMHKNSRLIIEEDVVLPANQTLSNKNYNEQLNDLSSRQPLFAKFLDMKEAQQRSVIILIDFLANCLSVGVPDIAFPCGFKSIDEWTQLFAKNNFELEQVKINGFVDGNFNKSPHVFFILSLQE